MPIPIIPHTTPDGAGGGSTPPPPPPSAGLKFYLIDITHAFPSSAYFLRMVRLETPVVWRGTRYWLVAASNTLEQDQAIRIVEPVPAGWQGTLNDAKKIMRASSLMHLWWVFDAFVAGTGLPAPVASRFIAAVAWADAVAYPSTFGFHPIFWDGGYNDWIEYIQFRDTAKRCRRVFINRLFGNSIPDRYLIGTGAGGTGDFYCEPLAPRILEGLPGMRPHVLGGFINAFGPIMDEKLTEGGEIINYGGSPSINFAGDYQDWNRESLAVGMTEGWDAAGGLSRDYPQQTVRLSDQRVAAGLKTYLEPQDYAAYRAELAGFYDGRFPFITTTNRIADIEANSDNYLRPVPDNERIALVIGADLDADATARYEECKRLIDLGYTACAAARIGGGTVSDLGNGLNMSADQLEELNTYGT